MEEVTMDQKLEENLPIPDQSHEDNADKAKTIHCGKYVVHISKQAGGEFKARYFQVNRDHTYCLPIDSALAKKRLQKAVSKASKVAKKKKLTPKVTHKVPQKTKPKKDMAQEKYSIRVYELKCGECDNKTWHDFKDNNVHLQEYLSEGVTICCINCSVKSLASLKLADQTPKVDHYQTPLLKCGHSECVDMEDAVFTTFQGLGRHREKMHPAGRPLKEPEDIAHEAPIDEPNRKRFKTKIFEKYSSGLCEMVEPKYKCTIDSCVRTYMSVKRYESHLKSHEPGAKSPCTCYGCRKKPGKKMLYAELSCIHCDHAHCVRFLEKSIFLTNGIGFICLKCKCNNQAVIPTILDGRKVPSQGLVFTCSVPNCEVKAESLNKVRIHMDSHEDPVTCDKCGMVCNNKKALYGHQLKTCRGVGLEPCVCHLCQRKFNNKYKLQQHLVRYHSKGYHSKGPNTSFLCDNCGFSTKYQYKLRKHKEKVHENPKVETKQVHDPDLVCPICSKGFKTKKPFKHHVKYNHRARRFPCDLCTGLFQSPSDLERHRKRHFVHNAKLFVGDNN